MKRLAQIGIIVNLLAVPAFAFADNNGWYLGVHYAEVNQQFIVPRQPLPSSHSQTLDTFPQYQLTTTFAKLGYAFNSVIALEARYGLGGGNSDGHSATYTSPANTKSQLPSTAEVDDLAGLYGRVSFRGNKRVRPYFLGGYSRIKIHRNEFFRHVVTVGSTINVDACPGSTCPSLRYPLTGPNGYAFGGDYTDHIDGFSYGAGVNLGIGKRWDLNVEYMNWQTNGPVLQTGADYDGVTAGVAFKF